jgi:hypothetical protein
MSNEITVCNKENGSFSQLWGRDCWVADSVLKLIMCHAEDLDQKVTTKEAEWAIKKIVDYCKELREQNRLYFYDSIAVSEDGPRA